MTCTGHCSLLEIQTAFLLLFTSPNTNCWPVAAFRSALLVLSMVLFVSPLDEVLILIIQRMNLKCGFTPY